MKSTKIILKNCSLIDANNEKPSAPCTVVINNDIIESITHEKCSDENAKVIDLHNHFCLKHSEQLKEKFLCQLMKT